MDHNKTNEEENQPTPIYETVPTEQVASASAEEASSMSVDQLQPEEIPAEVSNPNDAFSADILPDDEPPPIYEESKTKYFIIAGGVIFFIIVFILFLRILLGGQTKEEITLKYWGLWEEKTVYDEFINEYQKNNNVKIVYTKMSPEDYLQKLVARIKSTDPNADRPDIFRFHNTWLPQMKGIVARLPSSVMSNKEFEDTFYPIHSRDLKIGEDYYGIPLEVDGLVLVYNEELLKKNGFVKPPSNLDELTADNSYLEKLTIKDQSGSYISSAFALGTASNVEHFSDIFGLMLSQNGGDITKLDQPEAADALEAYRKFAEKGIWDESLPNSVPAFIDEKVAMVVVPSWEIITIKAAKPELKLKVAPVPFNLPGNPAESLATYWAEGVSVASKNQIEAWKFIKFLSEKENMTKLYEKQAANRIFGEPYSRKDLADKLTNNEYLGVVIQQAMQDRYKTIPVISRTADKGLNDGIVKYIENAINSAANGTDYAAALEPAKSGVDQIYAELNK